ncbi:MULTISPECIES: HAD family hydrolase [Olivibacter]|jgi:phosphoglycolate phosphatase-like HAD superfamily hydrolase|uniref:FMN phosphatase YigB (HAD superfamily) n=1 Tax=Olivibacter oleidegradans TaxID=760123 RepID=A0ABV6HJM1_9SPHI|nr:MULTISPECIES: HAD family hydrolase [Olivibacter]MDM8175138.1 HAD family hydrolase [Olivibacter sp. 47]QEL01911.1 HAD family hydrolase [Olivibacter sp. LS-1]
MLTYKDLDQNKKAFIFEVDDVLYPEKDYLLQVYYLFAHLLEYTETVPPANDLTAFMKKVYEHHGKEEIFQRAAAVFGIDAKYLENFKRIHVNAQLPLKLLLFEEVKHLLLEITKDEKRIFVLTKGNPLMQLNKLKQIDWGPLSSYIKMYFYDELALQGVTDPLEYLLRDNHLRLEDVLIISRNREPTEEILKAGIDYLPVESLLKTDRH